MLGKAKGGELDAVVPTPGEDALQLRQLRTTTLRETHTGMSHFPDQLIVALGLVLLKPSPGVGSVDLLRNAVKKAEGLLTLARLQSDALMVDEFVDSYFTLQ